MRSVGGGASSKSKLAATHTVLRGSVFLPFVVVPLLDDQSDVLACCIIQAGFLDAMFAHHPLVLSRSSAHFVSRPLRTA